MKINNTKMKAGNKRKRGKMFFIYTMVTNSYNLRQFIKNKNKFKLRIKVEVQWIIIKKKGMEDSLLKI